jgi:hypothetical protein
VLDGVGRQRDRPLVARERRLVEQRLEQLQPAKRTRGRRGHDGRSHRERRGTDEPSVYRRFRVSASVTVARRGTRPPWTTSGSAGRDRCFATNGAVRGRPRRRPPRCRVGRIWAAADARRRLPRRCSCVALPMIVFGAAQGEGLASARSAPPASRVPEPGCRPAITRNCRVFSRPSPLSPFSDALRHAGKNEIQQLSGFAGYGETRTRTGDTTIFRA